MFARVVGAPSSRDAGTRDGGSGVARAKHPGVRAKTPGCARAKTPGSRATRDEGNDPNRHRGDECANG
jgi:hypothetical protein